MTERIFRYVRLADVEAYAAVGWVSLGCLAGTHHGRWAELMEWRGPERDHPLAPEEVTEEVTEVTEVTHA